MKSASPDLNSLPDPTFNNFPQNLLAPLPAQNTRLRLAWKKRILFFDPTELYARITIDPYQRLQKHLKFPEVFPPRPDGTCSCGCGSTLAGRRRRWASDDCTRFATTVFAIIDGQTSVIGPFIQYYSGGKCRGCGVKKGLKVDHIVPVKHGGGGSWLSNFQLLCHACHVRKTNQDFGWKQESYLVTLAAEPAF